MRSRLLVSAILLSLPAFVHAQTATPVWQYAHANSSTGQSSEISAYDAEAGELWIVGGTGIEILGWADNTVVATGRPSCPDVGLPNSIAIRAGLVAATYNARADEIDGWLCLFDAATRNVLAKIQVGATPDMATFTQNGQHLLVANEAERVRGGNPVTEIADPPGSVTIIPLRGKQPQLDRIKTVGFPTSLPGIRIAPGRTATADVEPEYITVGKDSKTAWVTLQENNAIAEIDVRAGLLRNVTSLGTKSYNSEINAIDPNDSDLIATLQPVPVRSLYQPDAVADYRAADGRVYLVMANEGDARSDDSDVKRAADGSTPLFSPATLVDPLLRRLNVSTIDTTIPTDLVGFGARSFSIRTTDGELVYDSGKLLDQKAIELQIYADNRSDDKGVEPEGVAIGRVGDRTLAFIGLERPIVSAVAMFDITDPLRVQLIDFIVGSSANLNSTKDDKSPEGLTTFEQDGKLYLAVSHEVSHTTTLYEISTP
jgi:DNA-binding beta-propeller fold protein YncE